MTSSYLKTSVFARPHVKAKPAFSKILKMLKRCVFGDGFYRIRVDGKAKQEENFFKQKQTRVDEALSRSSERILIWCSCGTKAEIFELSLATAN